jgi:hypothetical protein
MLDLLRRVTVWLCDRHEQGMGLANVDAEEETETRILLGYPFEALPVEHASGSLLASAVCDLAAFLATPTSTATS